MFNYLNCTLALVALINPISKIFLISTLSGHSEDKEISKIVLKASAVAGTILISFAFVGNFILKFIFHVEIYSFQLVGGIILFFRGFQALNKGVFFELGANQRLDEASIVPLASPMIAGPATITAAMAFPSNYGMTVTVLSIFIAVLINFLIMLSSNKIAYVLKKFNLLGAMIRITGLVVAAIGAQMALDGISSYLLSM